MDTRLVDMGEVRKLENPMRKCIIKSDLCGHNQQYLPTASSVAVTRRSLLQCKNAPPVSFHQVMVPGSLAMMYMRGVGCGWSGDEAYRVAWVER